MRRRNSNQITRVYDIDKFGQFLMATAKEKKAEVKVHLKKLRSDLRKMHLGVTEELTLPEPAEVKKAMAQMEELLQVVEPKSSRKSKK